jgi:hypothetical protein
MKELETQFSSVYNDKIKTKYDLVDEDRLAGLAREAITMGYAVRDENGKINSNLLEQIAKFEHERLESKFQARQKQAVEKQKTANKQARDIGSGGGVVGQAPNRPKSIKEATEWAMRDLERKR